MKIKYFCLMLVFGLTLNITVKAQIINHEFIMVKLEEVVKGIWWKARPSGESGLRITVCGGESSRYVIPNAKIMIVSGRDTIKLVTNETGTVAYDDRLLKDSISITVSYPGRETVSGVIKIPALVQVELEAEKDVGEIRKK